MASLRFLSSTSWPVQLLDFEANFGGSLVVLGEGSHGDFTTE